MAEAAEETSGDNVLSSSTLHDRNQTTENSSIRRIVYVLALMPIAYVQPVEVFRRNDDSAEVYCGLQLQKELTLGGVRIDKGAELVELGNVKSVSSLEFAHILNVMNDVAGKVVPVAFSVKKDREQISNLSKSRRFQGDVVDFPIKASDLCRSFLRDQYIDGNEKLLLQALGSIEDLLVSLANRSVDNHSNESSAKGDHDAVGIPLSMHVKAIQPLSSTYGEKSLVLWPKSSASRQADDIFATIWIELNETKESLLLLSNRQSHFNQALRQCNIQEADQVANINLGSTQLHQGQSSSQKLFTDVENIDLDTEMKFGKRNFPKEGILGANNAKTWHQVHCEIDWASKSVEDSLDLALLLELQRFSQELSQLDIPSPSLSNLLNNAEVDIKGLSEPYKANIAKLASKLKDTYRFYLLQACQEAHTNTSYSHKAVVKLRNAILAFFVGHEGFSSYFSAGHYFNEEEKSEKMIKPVSELNIDHGLSSRLKSTETELLRLKDGASAAQNKLLEQIKDLEEALSISQAKETEAILMRKRIVELENRLASSTESNLVRDQVENLRVMQKNQIENIRRSYESKIENQQIETANRLTSLKKELDDVRHENESLRVALASAEESAAMKASKRFSDTLAKVETEYSNDLSYLRQRLMDTDQSVADLKNKNKDKDAQIESLRARVPMVLHQDTTHMNFDPKQESTAALASFQSTDLMDWKKNLGESKLPNHQKPIYSDGTPSGHPQLVNRGQSAEEMGSQPNLTSSPNIVDIQKPGLAVNDSLRKELQKRDMLIQDLREDAQKLKQEIDRCDKLREEDTRKNSILLKSAREAAAVAQQELNAFRIESITLMKEHKIQTLRLQSDSSTLFDRQNMEMEDLYMVLKLKQEKIASLERAAGTLLKFFDVGCSGHKVTAVDSMPSSKVDVNGGCDLIEACFREVRNLFENLEKLRLSLSIEIQENSDLRAYIENICSKEDDQISQVSIKARLESKIFNLSQDLKTSTDQVTLLAKMISSCSFSGNFDPDDIGYPKCSALNSDLMQKAIQDWRVKAKEHEVLARRMQSSESMLISISEELATARLKAEMERAKLLAVENGAQQTNNRVSLSLEDVVASLWRFVDIKAEEIQKLSTDLANLSMVEAKTQESEGLSNTQKELDLRDAKITKLVTSLAAASSISNSLKKELSDRDTQIDGLVKAASRERSIADEKLQNLEHKLNRMEQRLTKEQIKQRADRDKATIDLSRCESRITELLEDSKVDKSKIILLTNELKMAQEKLSKADDSLKRLTDLELEYEEAANIIERKECKIEELENEVASKESQLVDTLDELELIRNKLRDVEYASEQSNGKSHDVTTTATIREKDEDIERLGRLIASNDHKTQQLKSNLLREKRRVDILKGMAEKEKSAFDCLKAKYKRLKLKKRAASTQAEIVGLENELSEQKTENAQLIHDKLYSETRKREILAELEDTKRRLESAVVAIAKVKKSGQESTKVLQEDIFERDKRILFLENELLLAKGQNEVSKSCSTSLVKEDEFVENSSVVLSRYTEKESYLRDQWKRRAQHLKQMVREQQSHIERLQNELKENREEASKMNMAMSQKTIALGEKIDALDTANQIIEKLNCKLRDTLWKDDEAIKSSNMSYAHENSKQLEKSKSDSSTNSLIYPDHAFNNVSPSEAMSFKELYTKSRESEQWLRSELATTRERLEDLKSTVEESKLEDHQRQILELTETRKQLKSCREDFNAAQSYLCSLEDKMNTSGLFEDQLQNWKHKNTTMKTTLQYLMKTVREMAIQWDNDRMKIKELIEHNRMALRISIEDMQISLRAQRGDSQNCLLASQLHTEYFADKHEYVRIASMLKELKVTSASASMVGNEFERVAQLILLLQNHIPGDNARFEAVDFSSRDEFALDFQMKKILRSVLQKMAPLILRVHSLEYELQTLSNHGSMKYSSLNDYQAFLECKGDTWMELSNFGSECVSRMD